MRGSGIPVYDEEGLLAFVVPYDYRERYVPLDVNAGLSARHGADAGVEVAFRLPRHYAVPILNVFAACNDGLLQFRVGCPPELVRLIDAHEAANTYGAIPQPPPPQWVEAAGGNPWKALRMIVSALKVDVPDSVATTWRMRADQWEEGE